MSLAAGSHLGPYEILSPLGAGGMGVVYKARDTRLGREVAIKVLPESLSSRADVRERFEREARAISSLSHPHICPLYDVGSQDGVDYLVMEYLEGETLSHRLKKGALPLEQALRYAIEIASALDAAHRKGITHRDLKPGNVMLTKSGTKLLDFGLARVHARGPASGSAVATQTEPMTAEGAIVGTLQYMAPEQLEGNDADARTDIFAFGATLYEMATGRKAFEGQSSASLIAAIMHTEPAPISTVQPVTPPLLDSLVKKCLAKDPDERWHSAGDVAEALRWIVSASAPAKVRVRRTWPLWAGMAAGVGIAIAAFAFWEGQTRTQEPPELHNLTFSGHDRYPAASPDGRAVAFSSDRDGRQRIWLKDLARGGEVALTEGPNDASPRFSPDGSMILFTRGNFPHMAIYRIAIVGGDPRKLVDDVSFGDWSPDGRRIVYERFKTEGNSIEVATADGGESHEIAPSEGHGYSAPRWSPDGRTIAAVYNSAIAGQPGSVFLVGADGKNARSISAPSGGAAISSIAWSGAGKEVIYSQMLAAFGGLGGGGRLIRQNVLTGATEQLLSTPHDSESLDILGSGRLVFDTLSAPSNLREVRLKAGAPAPEGRWLTRGNSSDSRPAYSPDGEWVIFTSNRSGNADLWEISTRSGVLRRITEDPATDWNPCFTPDGKKLIWGSNRSGNLEIWIADADGSNARQVTHDGVDAEDPTATPDGWIVYTSGNPAKLGLWKIRQDGSQATQLVAGTHTFYPEVSPDGKYAAYRASAGLAFVRISDGARISFEVHVPTAFRPRWMPESRAIAFLSQNEKGACCDIYVQDFVPGQDTTKTRRKLTGSDTDMSVPSYGISPDGSRMTISYQQDQFNIMIAERVPGVLPPTRRVK